MTANAPIIENIALRRSLIWAGLFIIIAALLTLFKGILLPFVLGALIAYLLNPLIEPLEGIGAPRWLSSIGILALFFMMVSICLLALTPIIIKEANEFIRNIPFYIQKLEEIITPYAEKLSPYLSNMSSEDITQRLKDNAQTALSVSGAFLSKILAGTNMIIGFVTTLFLTPIVAFYMMSEWPNLTRETKSLIPEGNRKTVLNLLSQMDRSLAGFIRGQLSVCVVLGLVYGIALVIMGLKFGFLIGLLSGLLSFIPFVGSAFGLIASVGVAFFQFGSLQMVGIALGIFMVGQVLEGNILTPKLVGNSIQLHPLWIIFALMAGGSLMGFTGMLIALPVAAMAGVLVRFAIKSYKDSEFYNHGKAQDKSATPKKKAAKKTAK